jgi:formate hydrogenlyase transcriptional activator
VIHSQSSSHHARISSDLAIDLRGHGIAEWDYNSRMASAGQSTEQARQAQDVDAIPALAWSARPDGSAEFLNRRWLDYTGLSAEEASEWGWAAALHTEDRDRLMHFWRHLLDSGEAGEIEARLRRFDGDYRWFLFRVEPVRDNHGGILKWYGANTDIEDRKRTEALLAAEKRTLEMIASGSCLADILKRLCETIDAQASNIKSAVMLMDADGMHLRPAAGPRLPEGWVEAITPLKIGPCIGSCGTAAALKQRVIVSDIATDPLWADYRDLALSHGLRAAWSQPLLSKNQEILGTFCVSYAEPRTPNETDLRLIEGAGHIAVIAIEGERSQEALRSAFEEIRNSEKKLRKIIDTIPTLAWCSLPDGTGIFWNRRWHEYTGLSLEVVRGWGWQDAIHPEDLKEITDKWLGFLAAGQSGEVEGRLRRFDGAYRWFLFRAEPLRDESGNIVNWYGTDTDIDDLKRAEAKLRQDEGELRRMTDAIPQTIIVLNPDGKATYANSVALEYTGLSLDDVRADDFRARVFHPDDVQRLSEEQDKALSSSLPFENEERALGKDGRYRWFLIRYNPLLDETGMVIRWYATGTDIDDRKRNEDRTRNENVALREEIERSSMFEEIVGSSEALRRVLAQVSKVAPTDSTVLISGETGTGKELIARAIHSRSNRSTRAFIRVNCAAISPSLIASELFGHERGSFTGAHQRRLGRFESADGGTIFLDEIGEIPPETQVALLRVLQEHEFERVGGNQTVPVDVRVLAATNKDLRAAVADGTFRQDLFYRLNVFPIQVPALRDRVDDIPLLVEYLVDRYAKKAGKRIRSISKKTLDLFQGYEWPGNIRELQNVVERAVVLCEGEIFCVDPSWLAPASSSPTSPNPTTQTIPLVADLAERERAMIESALREAEGLISGPTGAAAKLGIPRQTLESKIRKLGISRHRFRTS